MLPVTEELSGGYLPFYTPKFNLKANVFLAAFSVPLYQLRSMT
jgi:hypothetical protein